MHNIVKDRSKFNSNFSVHLSEHPVFSLDVITLVTEFFKFKILLLIDDIYIISARDLNASMLTFLVFINSLIVVSKNSDV